MVLEGSNKLELISTNEMELNSVYPGKKPKHKYSVKMD